MGKKPQGGAGRAPAARRDLAFIGRNLRFHRRLAGLTIRELAARIGIRPGPNVADGRRT